MFKITKKEQKIFLKNVLKNAINIVRDRYNDKIICFK